MDLVGYPVPGTSRAKNPLAQVPFLEDDGVAMTESTAMLFYIAERYGPTPLSPRNDDPAFARVLRMTAFGETSLGAPINALLMDKFAIAEPGKQGALARALRDRVR